MQVKSKFWLLSPPTNISTPRDHVCSLLISPKSLRHRPSSSGLFISEFSLVEISWLRRRWDVPWTWAASSVSSSSFLLNDIRTVFTFFLSSLLNRSGSAPHFFRKSLIPIGNPFFSTTLECEEQNAEPCSGWTGHTLGYDSTTCS